MKIKITNGFFERSNENSPLVRLCRSTQLPVKTSYWLSRLTKEIAPLNQAYLEEKKKLIEKWCDKNEDGTPVSEKGMIKFTEHGKDFNLELISLINIEIELGIDKIEIPLECIPVGLLSSFDFEELDNFIVFKEN